MSSRPGNERVRAVLLIVCILGALVLWGCQSEQRSSEATMNAVCPMCQSPTQSMSVADLTYTKCICPACKEVSTLDASTLAAVEAYTGTGIGGTVQVCNHCKAIISMCAKCRAKQM